MPTFGTFTRSPGHVSKVTTPTTTRWASSHATAWWTVTRREGRPIRRTAIGQAGLRLILGHMWLLSMSALIGIL